MKKTIRISKCCVAVFVILSVMALYPSTPFASSPAETEKAARATEVIEGSMAEKAPAPHAAYDVSRMGDVSDFDPATWVAPKGDTIKVAYFNSFSGPGALNGQIHFVPISFAAHDINKRGGLMVDGKKKMIEVIAADTMARPAQTKKICERMVLEEKVHVLMGTSGSHLMKIINATAEKYKVIALNESALSDDLMNATNFNRYAFMASPGTDQIGRALAYFYGQIRKKEKKFYIICQDYLFGHAMAAGFKKGLKEYYPGAHIVGEDYHKLFLADFAPYLTKITASGAEAIYTGDWVPDSSNLLKQARQMGIELPFAQAFMNEPNSLQEVGVEGSKGLVHIDLYDMPAPFEFYPPYIKFYKAWNDQWKKWKTPPFNSPLFEHGNSVIGLYGQFAYWLFSVIERAGSTDPEKIITVWEGDTYRFANGSIIKMRACDHRAIKDFAVMEYVSPEQQKVSMTIAPYYWYKGCSYNGPSWLIPAEKVLPGLDSNLDRCAGKNDWGE